MADRIGLARDTEDDTVGPSSEQLDLATSVTESVDDLGHVVLGDHSIQVTGASSLVVN